jgi:hypothetical protein
MMGVASRPSSAVSRQTRAFRSHAKTVVRAGPAREVILARPASRHRPASPHRRPVHRLADPGDRLIGAQQYRGALGADSGR